MEAEKYCPEQTVWHRLTLVSGDKSETVFSTIISNIASVHYIMYIVILYERTFTGSFLVTLRKCSSGISLRDRITK